MIFSSSVKPCADEQSCRKRTGDQIRIEIDQLLSDYSRHKQPRRHNLICWVSFLLKVPEGQLERLGVGGAQLQMWRRAACDKRAVRVCQHQRCGTFDV